MKNAVYMLRFVPSERNEEMRRHWLPHGRLMVNSVGRRTPKKHVEWLIALTASDALQLVIIGDGLD